MADARVFTKTQRSLKYRFPFPIVRTKRLDLLKKQNKTKQNKNNNFKTKQNKNKTLRTCWFYRYIKQPKMTSR